MFVCRRLGVYFEYQKPAYLVIRGKNVVRINIRDRKVRYIALGTFAAALALISMSGRNAPHTAVAKAATTPETVKAAPSVTVDFEQIKPNEAGLVPILMYHNITGDKVFGMKYPVTMFRHDLEWLYDHNYRPISLTDFVKGKIDCPLGKSPVIITFDDGDKSQFCYTKDGKVDPNCAVAIMDKFHEDHPDWPTRATFFLIVGAPNLPPPFYQKKSAKEKLDYLAKQGYDIGNHTVHHPRMNHLSDSEATAEIAGCVAGIHKYLPGYDVVTLALPYGLFPKNPKVLASGEVHGQAYHNLCAMAAGWAPAPSPIDKSFHPYTLERIGAGLKPYESHWWFDYLEAHKNRKFVSDGDAATFTVPESYVAKVDKKRVAELGLELRTYGAPAHLAKKEAPDSKKPLTLVKTGGYTKTHN
jgi:peptidoglycan/xylan/chitin deacetylase (PgdA/CDA1 family)